MKTISVAVLLVLCLGCHEGHHGSLPPCDLQCQDFGGKGPVIHVDTTREADCRASLSQEATLHLCFKELAYGGIDCFYDCPKP